MPRRLRALLSRGGDAALAIALVVAFFLVFMVILVISFPKGVGISGEFRRGRDVTTRTPQEAVAKPDEAQWTSALAQLSRVQRTVKSREAGSIVWEPATQGLGLHEKDAVQTFGDSATNILFATNQEILLGENSLLVIRRSEQDGASGARRASVVLLGGTVEGSIAGSPGAPMTVEVVAGNATATIASPRSGTAKFRIAAAPDDTAVVSVSSGRAEVRIGDRIVTVNEGQAVSVGPGGVVDGPAALRRAPTLLVPDNGAVYPTRVPPTEVSFEWKGDRAEASYRIEIARDASFKEPLVDRVVTSPSYLHPDFPVGRYFWRVRPVRGPYEGRVAPARTFEVASDQQPPALSVEFPEGPLKSGDIAIRGVTEPGAKVFVGKVPAAVRPDGTFEGSVALSRGAQILVVEAVDAAGNIAYASRTLAAR